MEQIYNSMHVSRHYMALGVHLHAPVASPQERAQVPILRKSGLVAGAVWTNVDKRKTSCPHRISNSELSSS